MARAGVPRAVPVDPKTDGGAGDAVTLEAAYQVDGARCHALALCITRDGPLAAEVVTKVFADLARNPHRLSGDRVGRMNWLLTSTHALAAEESRRHRRSTAPQAAASRPPLIPGQPTGQRETVDDGPAGTARRALMGLPADQREVVVLAFFSGWSQVEIARRLGVSLDIVKRRTLFGMRGLQSAMATGE